MVSLAESIMGGTYGALIDLDLNEDSLKASEYLFGETPGRFIVSVFPESLDEFEEHFKELPCTRLGQVKEDRLIVNNRSQCLMDIPVCDLEKAWRPS